jgi:membrane-associated protease RseP (regulator of RpoE activity)
VDLRNCAVLFSAGQVCRAEYFVTTPTPENPPKSIPVNIDWRAASIPGWQYTPVRHRLSARSLVFAIFLFLLALCTCLVAGTQFAIAYARNQAVSIDELLRAFMLFYKNPAGLAAGLPFALTLMGILLAHELGHFFACRHHHIRSSYPFFIPFPSLIGTFGAFILIRSPIRTNRALFDVGASGPLVGFVFAVPALLYGVLQARIVPGLNVAADADVIFGTPLLLKLLENLLHPGVASNTLLLPPIGRAAWVGLFATSLNLLPVAQLDGGHILRSLDPRLHRFMSFLVPVGLLVLGALHLWQGWYIWGALLLGMRFLRIAPIYDPAALDSKRRFAALCTLIVFVLCFMASPIFIPATSH